ncbi:MAG: DUF308 domain-containing protein [Clostridia bacterium]|nr:DUF308 domain-containing protein [Clostridia bacterium]
MSIINAIKRFRFGYLVLAILLCTCGVLIIVYPNESMKTVSYIIGAVALIGGIIQVIKILADRRRGAGFAFSIITACVTIICAIVALIFPDMVMSVYPMLIGLFIIIDGAFKLQTVINSKRYNMKMWWFLLIIACLTIFGGFLCVRVRLTENNFGLFSFILGASLAICGIQNFFSLFYLGRIVKRATVEFNKHATDITEDAVVADSYISTDPKRIKEEILTIEDNKTINVADFEEVKEKEKIEK